MPTASLQHPPLRREIGLDFIRGIAILLVLDYHMPTSILLAPFGWMGYTNFGWIGVDVFFVLSGFLVGGLLIKEWRLTLRVDSKRFLIRRGLKIWPQYYFFLLATLLTGHRTILSLWGNLLNIQNYTGGIAHTWTLAVEEHAYLLLVFLTFFAAYKRVRMRTFFLLICGLVLLVLSWRTLFIARGGNAFARTDTRIDGILYGVLLAILYQCAPAAFRRIQSWTWAWIAVIVLALVYLRVDPKVWWRSDVSYACADSVGIALLLLLHRPQSGKRKPLPYRLVAWIGLYSYGIYLWHISVIAPIVHMAQRLPHSLQSIFVAIVPQVAAVGVGVLATRLIEYPALKLRDRVFPRPVEPPTDRFTKPAEYSSLAHATMPTAVDTPV